MAASYSYLAEASVDGAAKAKASDDMGAAYRELSEKYPQSEHAAAAFLSVGNDYYNKASQEGISADERTKYYRVSLDAYRSALQVPSIEDKVRMSVEAYIRETEELLAKDTYNAGYVLVPYEGDLALKKANAPKAIPFFQEVINTLPNTDYADLSYVQLGLCYEYVEDWDNSEKAYGGLIRKYTDASGNPIAPFSENVVEAVRFAKDRKAKIMAYQIAIKASQQ